MADTLNDLKSIFAKAAELRSPADRQAYLDEACAGDARLRDEVESLLRAHAEAAGFLEGPEPNGEGPGTVIGPYKLLEEIGEGGFGVVYMAEQTEPVRRKVALKILKPGMDTRQVIARFEAERQALAIMDHPNIAKVFDGGTTVPIPPASFPKREGGVDSPSPLRGGGWGEGSGRPYFVMELVKGIPITDYCDQNQLTPRERLELFVLVCQAVQHAHQKGVIHRDLKPANVLVTLHDGTPVPKVIDFGIAKATGQALTEKTLFTNFAQMVGTPLYMSPEQAALSGLDVDTRSDVYSLGVLLYELLTGTTPFDKERLRTAAYDEIRRIIREVEPLRPSKRISTLGETSALVSARRKTDSKILGQLLRGELDWIAMKALEKDRNRRYESASALAADVVRYLRDEPVNACPPSPGYRLRKFVRRNRGSVLAAGLVLAALVVGIIGTTWSMLRATTAHAHAVNETNHKNDALADRDAALVVAKDKLFLALVSQARAKRTSGRVGQRFEALKTIGEAAKLKVTPELRNEAVAALVLPDVEIAREWDGHPEGTLYWTFDASFQLYVRMNRRGEITVCRLSASGEEVVARLPAHGEPLFWNLWMSPDGRYLAYGHSGGREALPRGVRVWKLDGPTPTVHIDEAAGMHLHALSFHPDGRRLAIGHPDGSISVYDLETKTRIQRLNIAQVPNCLAFHPRDGRLAVACANGVRLFDVDRAQELPPLRSPNVEGWSFGLAWHPGGRILATTAEDRKIHLWDTQTAVEATAPLEAHAGTGIIVAFNHRGDRLLSSGWDMMSRLWDTATGQLLLTMPGRYGVRFSPDDSVIGVEQDGSKLRLWRLADGRELKAICRTGLARSDGIGSPLLLGEGSVLAASSLTGIGFFDLNSGKELAFLGTPDNVACPRSYHPTDGLMTSGKFGAMLWPIRQEPGPAGPLRIGPPRLIAASVDAGADASHDGRIRVIPQGHQAVVLDRDRPGLRRPLGPLHDVRNAAVSPDGKWVATCSWFWDQRSKSVHVWDAEHGRHVLDLPVEGNSSASFSPDGRWLATATSELGTANADNGSQLWEVGSWRSVRGFKKFNCWCSGPEGSLLAVNDELSVIRLVEPQSGQEVLRLTGPEAKWYVARGTTPDRSRLVATVSDQSAICVWDLRLIRKQLREMGLDWDWPEFRPPAPPMHDGAALAVALEPGILRQPPLANSRQAVAAFSLVLALQPINPEAYFQRGLAYGRLSESAKAIADYEMFLALAPKNDPRRAEIHLRRATNYQQPLKDDRKAISALLDVMDAAPELIPWPERYAQFCNHYAWLAVQSRSVGGVPEEIERLARKAAELEPFNFMYQNTLGVTLYRLGRHDEAIRCLEPNVQRSGKYIAFDLYFLAMSHQRLGETARARDYYDWAARTTRVRPDLSAEHLAELERFRAESAELLGIEKKTD